MLESPVPLKRSLRPAQAAQKLGISLPTLNRWARTKPNFPKKRKLSERVSVYDDAELDQYRDSTMVAA